MATNTGYGGTYAQTEYTISTTTFHAGDVVRMNDFSAFSDSVILGFTDDGYAKLARPYVYASGTGTTCATALTGVEIYCVPCKLLNECYKLMENDGHRTT